MQSLHSFARGQQSLRKPEMEFSYFHQLVKPFVPKLWGFFQLLSIWNRSLRTANPLGVGGADCKTSGCFLATNVSWVYSPNCLVQCCRKLEHGLTGSYADSYCRAQHIAEQRVCHDAAVDHKGSQKRARMEGEALQLSYHTLPGVWQQQHFALHAKQLAEISRQLGKFKTIRRYPLQSHTTGP